MPDQEGPVPAPPARAQALVPVPALVPRAPAALAVRVPAPAVHPQLAKHHVRSVPLQEAAVVVRSIPRPKKAR